MEEEIMLPVDRKSAEQMWPLLAEFVELCETVARDRAFQDDMRRG